MDILLNSKTMNINEVFAVCPAAEGELLLWVMGCPRGLSGQ